MKSGFLASTSMTYLDLMVYNEISQVLFFFHYFKENSRSERYTKFKAENMDWMENDELKKHTRLATWYNLTMKSSPQFKSVQKFDSQMRDKLIPDDE